MRFIAKRYNAGEYTLQAILCLSLLTLTLNFRGPDLYAYLIPLSIPLSYLGILREQRQRIFHQQTTIIGALSIGLCVCYLISNAISPCIPDQCLMFYSGVAFAFVLHREAVDIVRIRCYLYALEIGFIVSNLLACSIILGICECPDSMFHPLLGGRYQGMMGDPNMLATFTVGLLLYKIWILLQFGATTTTKVLSLFLLLLDASILIVTESRSAWIAGALGIIALVIPVLVISPRKPRIFVGLAGAAIMVIVLASAFDVEELLFARFQTGEIDGESERFEMVYTQRAIDIGIRNPLGVGTGNTAESSISTFGKPIGSHNTHIQFLSDNGWPAFIVFSSLSMYVFYYFLINFRINQAYPSLSHLALIIYTVLWINSNFHDMSQWPFVWAVIAICIAGNKFSLLINGNTNLVSSTQVNPSRGRTQ